MSNKNDAMNNFQSAIKNTRKKDEENKKAEEKRRKKQEQQEEFERKKRQTTPTNTEGTGEPEEQPQTEEQKQAEKAEVARHYNIYDDDDQEEKNAEDDDNSNNRRNRRNNDEDDDKDNDNGNDNNGQDNNQDNGMDTGSSADSDKVDTDNTDKNNKVDDSDKSNKSSSQSGDTQANGTVQGNGSTVAPDAGTSTTGSPGASTATGTGAETGTAAGAEATTAGAGAAEAGASAGASTAGAASGAATKGIIKKIIKLLSGPKLWFAILIIALIIIALIIVIGYIGFFINGVGLIREKLGEFANGIWTKFKGLFEGADNAQVTDEKIYDIATYLEDMGYKLAYSGFLDTDPKKAVTVETNEDGGKIIKSGNKTIYKSKRNEETGEVEITDLKSKYIKAYLAAENKTYMIANQNYKLSDLFATWDDILEGNLGTGMIHLENASSKVKIDRENKKMQIKYKGYVYQYDLDGWTGRYRKIF